MIEVVRNVDPARVHAWLESYVKSHLTPDVSKYARGRLRVWLGSEPILVTPFKLTQGFSWGGQANLARMKELVGWDFDYCLVTYSGDGEAGAGILPHRDAGYADYEAWGWNISGECEFSYWEGRQSFGYSPTTREFNPAEDEPTDKLAIVPGQVIRFNCKNLHSAMPGPKRWNLNFWKQKPQYAGGNKP